MLHSIAVIALTRGGAVLLDGAAYVLVARYLGPVEYGHYVSLMALAVLLDFAADMAVLDVTVREMARDDLRITMWLLSSTVLRAALAMVALIAFWAFLYSARSSYGPPVLDRAWIAALVLPAGALRMPFAVFRAKLRFEYELVVTLFTRAANLALVAWLVWRGAGLPHFLLAAVLSRTLLGLLGWIIGWKAFGFSLASRYFQGDAFRTLVRESFPMGFSGLLVAIQLRGDILIVARLLDARAAGIYGVVANLPEYFLMIPVVVTTPILPVLSRLAASGDRKRFQQLYQTVFDVLMAAVVPLVILASLLPGPVVTLLFGAEFIDAAPVLPLLMIAVLFMWFSHVAAIAVVATGLQRSFIWIQTMCLAAFGALNLLLIPFWGILGAAAARLTATVLAPLMTYRVVERRAGFDLNGRAFGRTALAGLLMAAVIAVLSRRSPTLAIVAGAILYVAVLRAAGSLRWLLVLNRGEEDA